jgi:sporulation protein YlmC with PRC-barrel domain
VHRREWRGGAEKPPVAIIRHAVHRYFQQGGVNMAQVKSVKTEPRVLSASTLKGDKVVNLQGEDLGKVEELMIDLNRGRVAYAVLSFGGFLGMGDKLFAIPWEALAVDTTEKRFVLNLDKELLKRASGFDKSNWPNMTDPAWGAELYGYYGYKPYWD